MILSGQNIVIWRIIGLPWFSDHHISLWCAISCQRDGCWSFCNTLDYIFQYCDTIVLMTDGVGWTSQLLAISRRPKGGVSIHCTDLLGTQGKVVYISW